MTGPTPAPLPRPAVLQAGPTPPAPNVKDIASAPTTSAQRVAVTSSSPTPPAVKRVPPSTGPSPAVSAAPGPGTAPKPKPGGAAVDQPAGVPGEWVQVKTPDGHTYYWNKSTHQTTWVKPALAPPPPAQVQVQA